MVVSPEDESHVGPLEVAMFTPLGLDHVVLRVRDQARSQRFYEDVLGCTLDHVQRADLAHPSAVRRRADRSDARDRGAGRSRPDHVCLSIHCDDLKAVAEEMRRKAVALEGDVVQRFGAPGATGRRSTCAIPTAT